MHKFPDLEDAAYEQSSKKEEDDEPGRRLAQLGGRDGTAVAEKVLRRFLDVPARRYLLVGGCRLVIVLHVDPPFPQAGLRPGWPFLFGAGAPHSSLLFPRPAYSPWRLATLYFRVIDLDSDAGDSKVNETERDAPGEGEQAPSATRWSTPQGTMGIVLIYLAVMAALWGYMYVILLRSEGVWSGLSGGV